MDIDRYLMRLDQIKIKNLKASSEEERLIFFALSSGDIGHFKWDDSLKTIWFSDILFDICGLDKSFNGTLLDFIQEVVRKEIIFDFLSNLMKFDEKKNKVSFDIDIFSKRLQEDRYVRVSLDYFENSDLIMGTLQDVHELRLAKNDAIEINDRLTQILNGVPLPIYYYDYVGNLTYKNEPIDWKLSHLNQMVEKHINGMVSGLETSEDIIDFEIKFFKSNHRKYIIKVKMSYGVVVVMIHRIQIKRNQDIVGILFIHEDITENFEQEVKIQKVLKTNELTIKIKDIVDQNVDLNVLFDFVLKNLSTVIPSVKRACVLKIDEEEKMYMAYDFGYDESYVKDLKMPFKNSFAYYWLKGNYSKSIIINDIQEKLSVKYPDLNKNQNGFIMESNMTAPILISNNLYGLLSVDSDVNNVFDSVDLNLIDYIRIQLERSIVKHQLLNKYKTQSISDPLTGVFNRRHLTDVYNAWMLKCQEESKSFALVIFDIDNLKQVNDQYGHLVGDEMLKLFSKKVLNGSRADDILARYGGDEFVGLFWDISVKDLKTRMSFYQESLTRDVVTASQPDLHVSFSYGISIYPRDGLNFEKLLDVADRLMYVQKNSKKDRSIN